jgi:hypothetical protein
VIETLIEAHIEAFNNRDLNALMAGFADDAVWITGQATVRGKAELAALFARALEGLLPTLTVRNLLVGDERAAAQLVEVFTHEGVERTDEIAGFYVFRNGLVTSAKIYRAGSADVA